jgi:hypothetical protein
MGQAISRERYQDSNLCPRHETVFDALTMLIAGTIESTLKLHGDWLYLNHALQTKCSDLELPHGRKVVLA